MSADPIRVADALNRQFFVDYPLDAAREIERLGINVVAAAAARQPAKELSPVWQRLLPERAASLLELLPDTLANRLLEELPPPHAVRILGCLPEHQRKERVARLEPVVRDDVESMMSYPLNTAGRLMDVSVATFRQDMRAEDALKSLRQRKMKTARSLFLVDDEHRLTGKVALQDLALASADETLGKLEAPIAVALRPVDPLEEVTAAFETHRVLDIPVIDLNGVFLGAVTHDSIAESIQQQSSVNLQTMVGASKDERALSSPLFTVRKRMPWLQINLLTAFLAAAVVGVFESTIAQVTALAVLLPVVAGQSGNAGAQALAVTMRGLALREITVRQWLRVMRKEVMAGFINGVGVALTCGLGVYLWSGSLALVGVIAASMVLAMVAAGFAGALIPIVLTRLGQDPATSSSILLTTVTDVAGFFSFLGIATIFMRFL
jgi:magnesium transporter